MKFLEDGSVLYEVGDVVRVKRNPVPKLGIGWNDRMDKYRGRIVTITKVLGDYDPYYRVDNDNMWSFVNEYFDGILNEFKISEDLVGEESNGIETDEFNSFISSYSLHAR